MKILQVANSEGTDETCRTFIIQGEEHTLGAPLQCIISRYPDVEFCSYTIPHPMEVKINFRIQMRSGRAVDALKRGLEDLVAVSDHILSEFERERTTYTPAMEASGPY